MPCAKNSRAVQRRPPAVRRARSTTILDELDDDTDDLDDSYGASGSR